MEKRVSALSNFVTKMDMEILKEEEAVLLCGGFAFTANAIDDVNQKCQSNSNCPCKTNFKCAG